LITFSSCYRICAGTGLETEFLLHDNFSPKTGNFPLPASIFLTACTNVAAEGYQKELNTD